MMNSRVNKKLARIGTRSVISLLIAAQIAGCFSMPRAPAEPDVEKIRRSSGQVGPASAPESPFIDVETGYEAEDMFLLRPMVSTGKLPNKIIAPFDLNQQGIFDTLRILIAGTGLTLKIEGGLQGSEMYGSVTMFDVQGSLNDVIENLSESMGFFYSVRKNTLLIQPEQQFVVTLPPALADDNTASLTNTLQFLGAKDTYIDRLAGTLVFKSNRTSLAKIEPYLNSIRENRSMIVYAINIFQVDLKDNADLGIQWNRLGWGGPNAPGAIPAAAAAAPLAGSPTADTPTDAAAAAVTSVVEVGKSLQAGLSGAGLGVVLSTARFSIDSLVNFLKTQGTVSTLSQPRITIMNGTTGSLSVGRTTTFVSRIGTTFSTSLNQITTETKDLDTGVDLQLRGQTSDNTVVTSLDMKIIDLISLTPIIALGTNLTTPDVAKRKLNNIIRTSPGEMFVMGGITLTRDSRNDSRGIANNGFSKDSSRSELVLALRTQIVRFLPKGEKARREAAAAKLQALENMPVAPPIPQIPAALPVRQARPVPPPVQQTPPPPLPAVRQPEPARPPGAPLHLRMSAAPTAEAPVSHIAFSTPATTAPLKLQPESDFSAGSKLQIADIQKSNDRYFPPSLMARAEMERQRNDREGQEMETQMAMAKQYASSGVIEEFSATFSTGASLVQSKARANVVIAHQDRELMRQEAVDSVSQAKSNFMMPADIYRATVSDSTQPIEQDTP